MDEAITTFQLESKLHCPVCGMLMDFFEDIAHGERYWKCSFCERKFQIKLIEDRKEVSVK